MAGKAARLGLIAGLLLAGAAPLAAQGLAPADAERLTAALAQARRGDFAGAMNRAAGSTDPALAQFVRWLWLAEGSASGADFASAAGFLERNPGWPRETGIRLAAEAAAAGQPAPVLLAFFERFPALDPAGVTAHADALNLAGRADEAAALLRAHWREEEFTAGEQQAFLARFGGLLTAADHEARHDRLIWAGEYDEAARMRPLVSAGQRSLADARQALRAMRGNVEALIAAVPPSLQNHPGLVFERARWRRRKNLTEGAIELLIPPPAEAGPVPALWWEERHILARRMMEAGRYDVAYQLARDHGQTENAFPRTQAEWVAGFLAYRKLGDAATGLRHFQNLYQGVTTPISLSRGAYWTARAAEDLGRREEAARWYQDAAQHGTTFYGQLAALRLGIQPQGLPADPPVGAEERSAFLASAPVRLAYTLGQIGEGALKRDFLRAIGGAATSPGTYALAAELARALGEPSLSVRIAKDAVEARVAVLPAGWPLVPGRLPAAPEPALILGVIRQESLFDPDARSPADARGLMQLLPSTAAAVARQLGLNHSVGMLTSDTQHNITLGSAYLQERIERFGGSYVLAVAGYNAGPARAAQWIQSIGDPRGREVAYVVDWIEQVPIYETRNYIQRVLENTQVYRARLGQGTTANQLDRDLNR